MVTNDPKTFKAFKGNVIPKLLLPTVNQKFAY